MNKNITKKYYTYMSFAKFYYLVNIQKQNIVDVENIFSVLRIRIRDEHPGSYFKNLISNQISVFWVKNT